MFDITEERYMEQQSQLGKKEWLQNLKKCKEE